MLLSRFRIAEFEVIYFNIKGLQPLIRFHRLGVIRIQPFFNRLLGPRFHENEGVLLSAER